VQSESYRLAAITSAIASPVMLGGWLGSFPDLRGTDLAATLLAVSIPYAAIIWFLRRSVTRPGIVLAAVIALLMLVASPVFAFYLFGTVIGAFGMPLPIALLGALIVAVSVYLLVCAFAMNRERLRREKGL
jgi:hypothetical protein